MRSVPYTPAQARALHALAESSPDPKTYYRERKRILASKSPKEERYAEPRPQAA